jgi:hypothetical protein
VLRVLIGAIGPPAQPTFLESQLFASLREGSRFGADRHYALRLATEVGSPPFPALPSSAGRRSPCPRSALVCPFTPTLGESQKSMFASPLALFEKENTMNTARCTSGLPDYGYSMQAAGM